MAAVAVFNCNVECVAQDVAQGAVYGKLYPDRFDDLAYENDVVGFRIYGPGTQKKGERSYGYDIFVKYPDSGIVLPYLFHEQHSADNWAKVDSLRKIDKAQAKAMEESISYHIDHGRGADFYAVGPTLGCGVTALLDDDGRIQFPWCYEKAEIVENGPDRFEAVLTFAPVVIEGDTVTERRRIVLDKGSYLNYCEVTYDGLSRPRTLVAGVPRRDDAQAFMSPGLGLLAYEDPTQRKDSGKIFTGVVIPGGAERMYEDQNHILASVTVKPGETFRYMWGNAWSKGRIPTFAKWLNYLSGRVL